MSQFRKQVEVIGVIVRGQEPGQNANKATGQNAVDPKTSHVMPGQLLIIDDKALYEKWKRMRVIRDYDAETGSRTRSLEAIFGPTDTEAFAVAEAAAAKELEELKARNAEQFAKHAEDLEAAKKQAREEARREILAEMAQKEAADKAAAEKAAAEKEAADKAAAEKADTSKTKPKGKAKSGDADADDLV